MCRFCFIPSGRIGRRWWFWLTQKWIADSLVCPLWKTSPWAFLLLLLVLLLQLLLLQLWLQVFNMCNLRGCGHIEGFAQGVKSATGERHWSNFVLERGAEACPGNVIEDFFMLL
jgi:hypothetical protein